MKYLSILLAITIAFTFQTQGQTPRVHDASLYVDSTGQVFTRADQPAYFFVSPAEGSGELMAVPSADPESIPMRWDGHGVHYIAHRDLNLNKTIRFRIMADGIPPITKLSFADGELFSIDNQFFVEVGAKISASATDGMTGVKETYISIDNLPYIPISEGIAFQNEGQFNLKIYSIDNVGNSEIPKEYKVRTSADAVIQMENIYFDLNSAKLRRESIAEIDKLVALLKKYPKIQMELRAHTDSRGESRYNLELSNLRAQTVVSFMISKGVDKHRLTAKGLGDTEPLNECKKGISCPEEKHRLNRRVEFRISVLDHK
jgi:outer membrane protein OmpA-like peptidoglycan-associated protein